jgi:hypothetical protein
MADESSHLERFEKRRRRGKEAREREVADDAKRDETRADELLQRGQNLEREAARIEASEPERATKLRHDATLDRNRARDIASASELAQERADDQRPLALDPDREEGGEA